MGPLSKSQLVALRPEGLRVLQSSEEISWCLPLAPFCKNANFTVVSAQSTPGASACRHSGRRRRFPNGKFPRNLQKISGNFRIFQEIYLLILCHVWQSHLTLSIAQGAFSQPVLHRTSQVASWRALKTWYVCQHHNVTIVVFFQQLLLQSSLEAAWSTKSTSKYFQRALVDLDYFDPLTTNQTIPIWLINLSCFESSGKLKPSLYLFCLCSFPWKTLRTKMKGWTPEMLPALV